jgi:LmbE family N-acetylglucosaminyl deacetylase
MENIALDIVAHPDDAEFLCAGTLALLHQHGWEIHIATMTAGDCGSVELGKEEISGIRKKEAARSAAILDGSYECLGFEDAFILYDQPSIIRTTELLRKVRPRLVLTMSPSDYMIDHEMTSVLAQTACFCAGFVNLPTPGLAPLKHIPHLYYADSLEGKDKFGEPVRPTTIVDISGVMNLKADMLACHASQREWLRQHHGMDEYILSMKRLGEARGAQISAAYGEGFRQHLGHAYPQDNLILEELKGYARQV